MLMAPDVESWTLPAPEWQSEVNEANAQARSHAAASGDTESSSAAIEPAKIRRIFISIFIVRRTVPALQVPEISFTRPRVGR